MYGGCLLEKVRFTDETTPFSERKKWFKESVVSGKCKEYGHRMMPTFPREVNCKAESMIEGKTQ